MSEFQELVDKTHDRAISRSPCRKVWMAVTTLIHIDAFWQKVITEEISIILFRVMPYSWHLVRVWWVRQR